MEHLLIKSVLCIKHVEPNSGLTASKMFLTLSKRNRLEIQLVSQKKKKTKTTPNSKNSATKKYIKLKVLNSHWKN